MRHSQVLIWAMAVLVSDVILLAGNALETIRKEVAEGDSVVFECDLDYDSNKKFYWVQDLQGGDLRLIIERFQNSTDLLSAYRNRTDITLEGPDGTSLKIGSVRRTDKATNGSYYECQQLEGDERKTRYELYVTYPPDPPRNIQVHGGRLYSFNISCTAGDPGGLTQKLCLKQLQVGKNVSICKEDIDRGEDVQFSVEGLNHNTTYQVCVYAENQLGSSGCGQASVVKVTTEAIGQFYASVRLLNVPFTSSDPNHQTNRDLVNRMNKTLIALLQPSHPDLTVEVTEIQKGSVIVTMLFKGVQKEMETINATLKQAVTGGDLARIGVDPHYFYTFYHRKSDTPTRLWWIAIVVVLVLVVLVAVGVLLVYCRRKNKKKEVTNMAEHMPTCFEGGDIKKLTERMKDSKICIVHGQFGIGKSYAVMNYVQAKTKSYVTWFIGYTSNDFSGAIKKEQTGLSLKTVREKLLAFVEELKESGRPVNIKQGETDISKICEALKASKSECLLVFDDVQDINVIPRQLLNPWPELTVLITTMDETMGQHPDASHIPCLKMNGFSSHSSPDQEGPSDAVSFLRLGREDNVFMQTEESLLKDLANQFACLPLGLSLAKSHILDSGTSVQEYLDHLHQQRNAMGRGNKDLSEPEENIFAAVQLLLNHRMNEVSRQVFQLMAFLMPNNIPTAFLAEAYWHLRGRGANIDEFVKAVRKLSLGEVTEDKTTKMRMMTIHQLTRRAILDMVTDADQTQMIHALVKAFLALLIKDTRETRVGAFVSQLLPHLLFLLEHHPALSLETILSVDKSNNPLLTALIRLHEVICYLYCQQRYPKGAKQHATKAKRLCYHLCEDLRGPSKDIKKVCGMLMEEGQTRFQQDVYGQTVTRQLITSSNIDVLKLKVPQSVTVLVTLASMVERFQTLSKEQYRRLITHGAALPDDKVQAAYLIELVVSVFYTSGRILFYLHGDDRKKYFDTASKELHFSHELSREFASNTDVHLLNEMLSKRAGILYLRKETWPSKEDPNKVKSSQEQKKDLKEVIKGYNKLIEDRNCYFEYGILKKFPKQDNFNAMFCYRSIVDCYKRLTKLASSTPKDRQGFIRGHNANADKMIEYAEKQGTRVDQQGPIIDGIELLPEVYNMRAQFIIDMYAAGFKDELPEDDRLQSAACWAKKALSIVSCKPLHKAKANQLLASVFIKAYEHQEELHFDHEDIEVTDETTQLIRNRHHPNNSDMLKQAGEHLQKSKEIYKEFPNATADISENNKLVEKLSEYEQKEAPRQAQQIPSQEALAATGGGGVRDPTSIEMDILPLRKN
ncbi:PREDICTED: uncharacterized protein LOC109473001 [Branchiostoma belcheri]|uniref:Uncharacterized protein LOC109473001 n=1 Tax=Branchiostoma belcheri TaxID=7741 RepID=A0A6P4YVQ7_BRABE|nr:PREDICTED: uncharacterized protein LOC109473001 [Branchiostoma belcheri]